MAKKAYIGVLDKARRVRKAYIGVDGKARKVRKIYLGVNGVAKLVSALCQYRASFNGNGGSGSTADIYTIETMIDPDSEGLTVTLPANPYTRSGYMFKYWCTTADGSGAKYAPGAVVTLYGNTTFYAQWVRMTQIHWAKTADINYVADWITDIENATGPVLNGPNNGFYLGVIVDVTYAAGEPRYWEPVSLNWNETFGGGGRVTKVLDIPASANVKCYLANNYNNNGGPLCCIYLGDTTSSPVLAGPGETATWGVNMMNYKYISMWANWKTSGGVAEIVGWDGIWPIFKDTRQSWWDLHVTLHT